jgi:hypothetical protein
MNLIQKAQLFITLLFLGQQASFTFYAGKSKYLVMISYTSQHQYLSISAILSALEGFSMNAQSLPYSVTVGNTAVTVTQVL